MEVWDVYDINRYKTGKTMLRGAYEEGLFHLVVHVCIFDSNGRMLIQQRQKDKDGWPNLWDITLGGSAIEKETAQMAAMRELKEELGLEIDLTEIRPHITINFNHGFDDIFLLEKDVDIHKLILQKEEVQNVRWASRDEIQKMIKEGSFISYYPSLIDLFFDSRACYGMHKK